MSFLFDDDICWCANECDNLNCFRNLKNRKRQAVDHDVYTAAYLKDTECCPSIENLEKS